MAIRSQSIAQQHAEWLSLLEISGPFLSLEVLLDVFPQMNLEEDDPDLRQRLRLAYEEWQDNQLGLQPDPALHRAWLHFVLTELLVLPAETLQHDTVIPASLQATMAEHGETLRPDVAVIDPDSGQARLLIQLLPIGQRLDGALAGRTWKAAPTTRMMELLHATNVRLGLVTNGEQWLLVNAPRQETTGFIAWYAQLWVEEPLTLRAWRSLLSGYRFFNRPEPETLEGMLARSTQNQHAVTDQLGYQMRRAVELLVQALDRANRDTGRNLLAEVSASELYEAAVTVMMRLVFLFSAEERGLLPLDEALYQRYYAASPLRSQLREAADAFGEEVIERRTDAWCRLLTTFRAIYGGIDHERQRLPAYGGHLFDPDRFPFLEGRRAHSSWIKELADPLPINNRTVLHLLEALQLLEIRSPGGERQTQRLSFRALDVEQIGHIYEGLLDHQAVRSREPILGLAGTQEQEPELALTTLAATQAKGEAALVDLLKAATGRSPNALRRALTTPLTLLQSEALRGACGNDDVLYGATLPFANLLRDDGFGHPVVIHPGSLYVTAGATRRATGAHYTPRSLTEPIVQHTLEPLVYHGPAEGLPRTQWRLRSPHEILALKVCDMAMGSGAFLVQCCRYLAERLVEALEQPPSQPEGGNTVKDEALARLAAVQESGERLTLARRLIAERCLYGVDKNPLAVEMAKLSLWLITLDKGRPFSFLDHALKCGDSLVGIYDLNQLRAWRLDVPKGTHFTRQFGTVEIDRTIQTMIQARHQIEALPVMEIEDLQSKAYLLAAAEAKAHDLKTAANLLVGSYYNTLNKSDQETLRSALLLAARDGANVEEKWRQHANLTDPSTGSTAALHPFHWPLEFPEVFLAEGRAGFDAFVGNPPFMGGQKITGILGTPHREYLVNYIANGKRGSTDLCVYFILRSGQLISIQGFVGLIVTSAIAEGDSRETGLEQIVRMGYSIIKSNTSQLWPGTANVTFVSLWFHPQSWKGEVVLNNISVSQITPFLTGSNQLIGKPQKLKANSRIVFQGAIPLGKGFLLDAPEAEKLISINSRNKDVIWPYMTGKDVNEIVNYSIPPAWIINFQDWPLANDTAPNHYLGPVAQNYPECLAIVKDRVKPERDNNSRKSRREKWWQYGELAKGLYESISNKKHVWAIAEAATKYVAFGLVPRKTVFSHSIAVIASDKYEVFTILSCNFHDAWARAYGSYNLLLLRYTPSDVLETYPFPQIIPVLETIGEAYHEHRRQLMLTRQEGLTATYNRFHNPTERAADIVRLRALHVEMDHAVAAAYGWADLLLDHDFHETQQGLRYTISETARREVLARLLALNHQRYAEEVAAGLHDKKGKKGKAKATGEPQDEEGQLTLFG